MSIDIVELNNIIEKAVGTTFEKYEKTQLIPLVRNVKERIRMTAEKGLREGNYLFYFGESYNKIANITALTIQYLERELSPIHFIDREVILQNSFPYSVVISFKIPTIEEVKINDDQSNTCTTICYGV